MYHPENDPVLQDLAKKMMALQAEAEDHMARQMLPNFNVKMKGYAHGTKEILADLEGEFRLDTLIEHIDDRDHAIETLLDGLDRVQVNKIRPKLGRVLFVIDGGKKDEPPEAPRPPSAPPPSGGSPILMAA